MTLLVSKYDVTGIKQFKGKCNLLSKLWDYLFYIALLLNSYMRSKLKNKLFYNLENTKSLSGNIYVVIVNQQIRYFLN